ncbi:hypothetical protein [Xenorhabdus bovienii]|uniref:Tc toxin complex TcA C-terminal TcB-binding domain-containing protein n=1 Tax=Xenorhabdus bovienii str. kraussei Becker Underwood TaxID=1398204 RepID=A0A077Q0P0_XENBV|nr:hypothetical protein [Xenorhabdus bovienii]CDH25554.1 hypothetical protein XBKB1_4120015 [Xenorhabdus bovienii str. kraussei Becker Underwood]
MVDVQREGDPWMGVLLYDSTPKNPSVWKKNQDYFLELRDLLLVDKKALNDQDENTLISSWYKIFKNSDTLQHHYVGTEKLIEFKASEGNKNLILRLDAKLSEDKTKLILTGTNILIKRNPKGYGTKFRNFNNSEFSSKLSTKDFNGTIPVGRNDTDNDSIKIHIPASETSQKTFHFTWQGDKAPTSTFTVYYGGITLFTVSPNGWKNNTVTKLVELNWLNNPVMQRSEEWKLDTSTLTIATEDQVSRHGLEYYTLTNWEYTKSKLTLTLDTPSGTAPTIKEVILGGSATTKEITIPIRANIDEYSFTLSATLETVSSGYNQPVEYAGTVSNKYQIIVRESDRIPVITLSRNTKQAQYLDITSLGFHSTAIRLNTLFGKQLVARATQSIDRVLSWDTQSLLEPTLDDSTSSTPIDFSGANGIYFWELFFHLPFLVTYRLSEEQRFYDARRWLLNYLFDPYGSMRMWNSRPIIENGSNLPPSVKEDDSDTIAYSLPVYYQKALFHFQITLWIQEGDNLYRQLTRDSLNEASLCYQQALQLLGTLPEGLDVTRWYPVTLEKIKADFEPSVRVVDGRPFVSPFNSQLIEYQKTLNNRLYNLRHGLTLDGKVLPLPLYAGAEDDDSLIQRRAGSSISRWNNLQQQVPPYRFPMMLKRASDAVKQLIQMGHRLFKAIESEVNAEQEVLEQSQVLRLSAFSIELQQEAVQIAQLGKATLEESKNMAQERYEHYHSLYDENLSAQEISALTLKTSSEVVKAAAAPFYAAGAALEVVPNIFGLAVGGGKYAAPIKNAAIISELISDGLALTADRLQDSADYERRRQEWEIEYKQAQSEINIIERQLQEQELLIKSANTALQEAQAQQSAARELYEFMTTGFLIVPTYQWLMGRLAALYAPAYDAVLSLCLMAEASWRYEVGDYQRRGFIKTTAWNDSYRGLLAGESLQLDLLQMENAWLQSNERRMNIKKTISLSELLTAHELQNQIEKKQVVSFTLNPKLFDTNYPGHYLRQIKRISVSISLSTLSVTPILSPEISAVLTQTGSSTLTSADIEGINWLYDPSRKAGNNKNIVTNLRAQQQIALSSLSEDDGSVAKENWLYTLMFDDDRYLPFEGTGAISTWTLAFPDKQVINKIFRDPLLPLASWRLKDINIHVHYTAVDGGKQFTKAVKDKVGNK